MFMSRRLGGTPTMFSPYSRTWPDVGCSKPAIIRSVVVLPQPDGPSSEKNSPVSIARSTRSTAWTLPVVGGELLGDPDQLDRGCVGARPRRGRGRFGVDHGGLRRHLPVPMYDITCLTRV